MIFPMEKSPTFYKGNQGHANFQTDLQKYAILMALYLAQNHLIASFHFSC